MNHCYAGKTVLITGACGVTSRTIARALRRSDLFRETRLVGTDICDNPFGLYEGLYERVYRVPPHSAAQEYRRMLESICKTERIDVALVVPEPEVLFWAHNPMPVPALLPPPKFAQLAISKARLYEFLNPTGLVPRHAIVSRERIGEGDLGLDGESPLWLRDVSPGSTSGNGAICISEPAEAAAWMTLNPRTEHFMVSQYLPGRNLACLLLYVDGLLVKRGCYERLEYFMAKTVISGVSGNICKGRLINDEAAAEVAQRAVELLCAHTEERMNGMVTVDLRTDASDAPKITEINLRQVAAASAFAELPGANLAEAQLLASFGDATRFGVLEVRVPPHNRMFRDIDGLPVFVADYRPIALGECIAAPARMLDGAKA